MKLTLIEEKFVFDFPNARELYKFDERDSLNPHFHGVSHCMKAVDVIAVFDTFQLWIEIKDFPNLLLQEIKDGVKMPDGRGRLAHLKENLRLKFRDTWLYRHCENQLSLPIYYICIVNFDKKLTRQFKDELSRDIPVASPTKRWSKELLPRDRIAVVNVDNWPQAFVTKFGTCKKI